MEAGMAEANREGRMRKKGVDDFIVRDGVWVVVVGCRKSGGSALKRVCRWRYERTRANSFTIESVHVVGVKASRTSSQGVRAL